MNKKNIIAIIIIIIVILLGTCFIFSHYYNQLNYKTEDEISSQVSNKEAESIIKEEQDENAINSDDILIDNLNNQLQENSNNNFEIITDEDVTNILLIGTDNRSKKGSSRSDAMMVLSINTKEKTITLTSVLRDIYVEIPGYNNNKLNSAYAFGGVKLLKETLNQNFKINIDRYVIVDFFGFISVVDALNGLELEITEKEKYYINEYVKEINLIEKNNVNSHQLNNSGTVYLDGHQALAYARIRYIGTDFGRTERQRKILEKLFLDIKDSDFSTLNNLYFEIAPNVTTDMTESEILGLLFDMVDFKNYKIQQNYIPYENTYEFYTVNKMSVIGIDFEKNINRFNKLVYNNTDNIENISTEQ